MTGPRETPAAQRYKDVIAGLTLAANELRERDRLRAVELGRQLVDLDAEMSRAELRSGMSIFAAEMAWENALDALWKEEWMTLRPRPTPDQTADPARLDALDREVERAARELNDAARRRFWQL